MNARFARGEEAAREAVRVERPIDDVRGVIQLEPSSMLSDQSYAEEVLERLARAGRFRDEETAEHVERMSRSCALIARAIGWDAEACSKLRAASAMHDIGKVGVPDAVLRKPGRLTGEERQLVEVHTQIGHDILAGSDNDVLILAATVALTHHESFDGTGYPHRLRGEEIPLVGRVAAVADVFDALTHDRIYRGAFSLHEALALLREESGTRFDPNVVAAFETVLPEIEQVRELYPESGERPEDPGSLFVSPERAIRVLVVEDHPAVARGLELLLRREGMEITGSPMAARQAATVLRSQPVDVVVINPGLNGQSVRELIGAAKRAGTCVLLYADTSASRETLDMPGVDGVAAREGSPAEFVAAVRAVARGETHVDARITPAPPAKPQSRLTAREREVVGLLARGLTGEDIAARLFLSGETIRTHIRNAMQRLEAHTRAHLIALAIDEGEIALDSAGPDA